MLVGRWMWRGLGEGRREGEGRRYLEVGCEHTSCDDEVGDDEAGHAEGKEDGLAGICCDCQYPARHLSNLMWDGGPGVPGCSVESTTFFACHSSGVMVFTSPCLYDDSSLFAFSSPEALTKRVLWLHRQRWPLGGRGEVLWYTYHTSSIW